MLVALLKRFPPALLFVDESRKNITRAADRLNEAFGSMKTRHLAFESVDLVVDQAIIPKP